jgi:hypothetical protein
VFPHFIVGHKEDALFRIVPLSAGRGRVGSAVAVRVWLGMAAECAGGWKAAVHALPSKFANTRPPAEARCSRLGAGDYRSLARDERGR